MSRWNFSDEVEQVLGEDNPTLLIGDVRELHHATWSIESVADELPKVARRGWLRRQFDRFVGVWYNKLVRS